MCRQALSHHTPSSSGQHSQLVGRTTRHSCNIDAAPHDADLYSTESSTSELHADNGSAPPCKDIKCSTSFFKSVCLLHFAGGDSRMRCSPLCRAASLPERRTAPRRSGALTPFGGWDVGYVHQPMSRRRSHSCLPNEATYIAGFSQRGLRARSVAPASAALVGFARPPD